MDKSVVKFGWRVATVTGWCTAGEWPSLPGWRDDGTANCGWLAAAARVARRRGRRCRGGETTGRQELCLYELTIAQSSAGRMNLHWLRHFEVC